MAVVNVSSAAWVELTDADVTGLTFQNKGPHEIAVMASADATPPSVGFDDALIVPAYSGLTVDDLFATYFPHVASAARLFARTKSGNSVVWAAR